MFKGMSEDALIKEINTLAEKDPDTVKALVAEFNKSQKFAKGGKIDHMVSKFQNGGAALRKAQRQEYKSAMNAMRNDEEMNKYRRGYLRGMARERANNVAVPQSNSAQTSPIFDRTKAQEIMSRRNIVNGNYGDNRVLVKKAKAAATEGFDESMYNFDPNQTFDRSRFRDRKQVARIINPEWN